MKLPRDVSGDALARGLARVGYQVTRQTGSHIRLMAAERLQLSREQLLTALKL